MVRLEKHGDSAVRFIFTDSDHYLYKDGVVDVPVNSLSLVIDESEMVTFKKASTADPFISFRLDKSNFSSRDELLTFYKENMVGAGGISEEEVQQMIDAATSGIPSSQVIEQLRSDVNAVSGTVSSHTADTTVHFTGTQKSNYDGLEGQYYVDNSWDIMSMNVFNDFTNDYSTAMGQFDQRITAVSNGLNTISGDVENKVDTTTYESGQYATAQALNALQENKLDASAYTPTDLSEYWTSGQTQEAINAATSGIPSSQVIEQLQTDVNNLQGETNDIWDTIDEKEEVIASALTQLNQDVADIDAKEEVIASALTEVRHNKQDALVYYSEIDDIEYGSKGSDIGISQGTDENNVNVTFDVSTIYTEDEKSSGVYIQTDIKNDDGIVGSHINVENGFIDISNEYTPNEGELSESHIYMSQNGTIEIGNSNEDGGTLMFIQPTGVTINDERVLTEGDVTSAITSASTNSEVAGAKAVYDAIQAGGGGGSVTVDSTLDSGSTNPVANSAITQAITAHTANTTVHVTSVEKDAWNAKANIDHVTQAEYSAMEQAGTLDSNTMYIIDDAVPFDPSTKQDVLSAGTGISISNNVISTSGVVMSQNVTQLVKLTQAAYDTLATKDSSTLYIISD